MRKVIYSALIAFFLLVALLSSLVIYQHFKDSEEQADIYEEIANLVSQNEAGNQEPAENPTTDDVESQAPIILPEYEEIYEQNHDMVGWTSIADKAMTPKEPC